MGFSPLVNTLQFLQGVNARETCASFWTGRWRDGPRFFKITPLRAEGGFGILSAMGQQLRTRAKRARRKAQAKRAHARQLEAKKAK